MHNVNPHKANGIEIGQSIDCATTCMCTASFLGIYRIRLVPIDFLCGDVTFEQLDIC